MQEENLMSTKEKQVATHHIVLEALENLYNQLNDLFNYLDVEYRDGKLQKQEKK